MKRLPFIRPTRRIHGSGYKMFEVGYLTDEDKEEIVNDHCDHVYLAKEEMAGFSLNIDCDRKGRIRFYRGFKWEEYPDCSSVELVKDDSPKENQ